MSSERCFLAVDAKSFYASVECVDRHLDPLSTNLVVADMSRTEKTICLAVTPSLKANGVPGRPRLFEVVEKVKGINQQRLRSYRKSIRDYSAEFVSKSYDANALATDLSLELDYIVAPPRMARYVTVSTQIYAIYLKFVSPDDIFAYSIDEVFIDISGYLQTYRMTAREFAMTMIREVLYATGITATAGIGSNMYLAKVAMDIAAKHLPADEDGVRIAELDEYSYRRTLWGHKPLTDFWRVGAGTARKLEAHRMFTMGDVARCSIGRDPFSGEPSPIYTEALLYKLFGVNAELLIDHAWGWEPTSIEAVKSYRPSSTSISSGQVLRCPYEYDKAQLVTREMAEALSLDLVAKGAATDQIVLTIGYDRESLLGERGRKYLGLIVSDHYGRAVPKHAHGTENLPIHTSSARLIVEATMALYKRIVNPDLLVRRVTIAATHIISEEDAKAKRTEVKIEQLDFFTDYEARDAKRAAEEEALEKEKRLQQAMVSIRQKYGKNALLKAMNLTEGATMMERNEQIGGHKAGE